MNCTDRQVAKGHGRAEQRDQRGVCFKRSPEGAAREPAPGYRLDDQRGMKVVRDQNLEGGYTFTQDMRGNISDDNKQLKADVEKTEKDLAYAKDCITSKDTEVSTVHLCVHVCICVCFFVRVCVCVCV